MSGYRPPRHSALGGVQIKGRGAWVLAKLLENANAFQSIRRIPADAGRADAMEAYEALRAAAIYWAAEREDRPGNERRTPTGDALAHSQGTPDPASDAISAADAAALIGCTERRVRQLLAAETLEGKRVAGRWLLNARSVEAFVLAREAA